MTTHNMLVFTRERPIVPGCYLIQRGRRQLVDVTVSARGLAVAGILLASDYFNESEWCGPLEFAPADSVEADCICPKAQHTVGQWTASYRSLECPIHGDKPQPEPPEAPVEGPWRDGEKEKPPQGLLVEVADTYEGIRQARWFNDTGWRFERLTDNGWIVRRWRYLSSVPDPVEGKGIHEIAALRGKSPDYAQGWMERQSELSAAYAERDRAYAQRDDLMRQRDEARTERDMLQERFNSVYDDRQEIRGKLEQSECQMATLRTICEKYEALAVQLEKVRTGE